MIHSLILPDGTVISSGKEGTALLTVTLTKTVNSGQELTLGSVCAEMLEATIFAPEGLALQAGQEVILQKDGAQAGIFLVEQPEKITRNTYRITAYDRVCKLDKEVGEYLDNLTGWPYRLSELAQMICGVCDVTLAEEAIPNGDYPVAKFDPHQITARQVMRWIGEASARFCCADAQGQIHLGWYTPSDTVLTPSGELFYYQDSLTREDYTVAPIEKVQISLVEGDVGAVYPDTPQAANTYRITGNYLLTGSSTEALQQVAQGIYEELQGLSYVPFQGRIPLGSPVYAGQKIAVIDPAGSRFETLIMEKTTSNKGMVVGCTGSRNRESTAAANQESYRALSGKVLILQKGVEGLRLENREAAGKTASLALDVEGLRGQAVRQEQDLQGIHQQITTLSVSAGEVAIAVQSIQENGVSQVTTATGYTFGENGLRISKAGQEMANTLDHTGMYVSRSGKTILQADTNGVVATDVTARNYLSIGHSRLEAYSNEKDSRRTACFFVQEVL